MRTEDIPQDIRLGLSLFDQAIRVIALVDMYPDKALDVLIEGLRLELPMADNDAEKACMQALIDFAQASKLE